MCIIARASTKWMISFCKELDCSLGYGMLLRDYKKVGLLDGYEKDGIYYNGYHNVPLIGVKLVPVNYNKHDKNAIEVHPELTDGRHVHIGHIPRELCKYIRDLLNNTPSENIILDPVLTFLRGAGKDDFEHGLKIKIMVIERV